MTVRLYFAPAQLLIFFKDEGLVLIVTGSGPA